VQLVVTDIDSGQQSAAAIRNVSTNLPPVAAAGADQAVDIEAVVALDGSGSYDPDTAEHGDTITFAWTLSVPVGSAAVLDNASAQSPTFTADLAGDYLAELTVSDGELSDTDAVTVTAADQPNQPPIADNDFFDVAWKTTNRRLHVLSNDSDPDGAIDGASLTIVTDPITSGSSATAEFDAFCSNDPSSWCASNADCGTGTCEAGTDHIIVYTPKNGFKGTDYLTYEICDDGTPVECSMAEVWVNVVK
jgi:hypothetical protein